MSRQYDAKQHVLKIYPPPASLEDMWEAKSLFLDYLDVSESDFEYEEGMTVEEYIYGKKPETASE